MSRVIDAHVHVWGRELLDAAWLRERAARPLRAPFDLDMLTPDLVWGAVDAVVLVTADESMDGTRRLLEVADDPRVAAVVGWVDLTAPDVARDLAVLRAEPHGARLRGVRHPLPTACDTSTFAALSPGLDALEEQGLVLELLVAPGSLPAVAALAAERPGLRIVVDHLGRPEVAGWRDDLPTLRDRCGVALKVSGSGLPEEAFAAAVEVARRMLGADRLVAGSDWPVVLLRSDHRAEWARLQRVTASWTPAERTALFGRTASRVYGIAA